MNLLRSLQLKWVIKLRCISNLQDKYNMNWYTSRYDWVWEFVTNIVPYI